MCYCIYMEKDTRSGTHRVGDRVGELWKEMEKETDLRRFTLLCEEFAREGGVRGE